MGDADGAGDDLKSSDVGVLFGFGGFSLGVNVGANTDFNEAEGATVGLKYGFGAANVSVGYVFFDPDDGDSTNLVAVSGDIGLMPGRHAQGRRDLQHRGPRRQ